MGGKWVVYSNTATREPGEREINPILAQNRNVFISDHG